KVQRVALLKEYRGKGLGIDLMNEIKQYAAKHNGNKLILDAQDHALPFYKKLGYTICSEGFMDAGIPHHSMELILQSAI
ncbi:MAG: GNAT family N-acetyltransferase, partial [Pisciglobus halotolerans]|nr:GNAT family N-acetyltransferase [Pisciglobus halotolerans]